MAPSSTALVLGTEAVSEAQVHPTVIFQILDRALRRGEGQERVIGTLLGHAENGVITVTNSFAVPHLESGEEVAVGKDYHTQMLELHRRVNDNETVVGWYATTTAASATTQQLVDEHSCLIHEFYGSVCELPVHLVVDTSLQSDALQVSAFVSAPLELVEDAMVNQFKQVRVTQTISEPEAIALHTMTANPKQGLPKAEEKAALDRQVTTLPTELATLDAAMTRLYECLDRAGALVQDVLAGNTPADAKLGREIADALAAIPMIQADQFDQMFSAGVQDLLMVSYLSGLTQAQLSMAEKLINT